MKVQVEYKDRISPSLRRSLRKMSDRRPVLEAMGLELESYTKRAFNMEGLRVLPWAPVKKAEGAPLKRSGMLWQSIRVVSVSNTDVVVGTDRLYAAVHQLGGRPHVIRARNAKALYWPGAKHPVVKVNHPGVPARPFFPFIGDQMSDQAKSGIEKVARAKIRSILGGQVAR